VQAAARETVRAGLADAAHDLSDGGLAVALAECSLEGIGADVDLACDLRPEFLLFHEGPSRILIATDRPAEVERLAAQHGIEVVRIGQTVRGLLRIRQRGRLLVDCSIAQLRAPWASALESWLRV